tara:strand:+ start:3845 stop:4819 length:975 start_codon:yes stop_codon:yes gene_type:complete
MTKKVLLTGCAGFVGSKVLEILLKEDYHVVGLDNINDYYDISLKHFRLNKFDSSKNFFFKKVDIENYDALEEIFSSNEFDVIINLAARAGVRYSIENPFVYLSSNSLGSLNLLELAKKYNVPKYILASTSSLYAGQKMPYLEDLPVNEPISPYAASKKSAEVMAYTYHKLFKLDVSVVRYFTVYGPGGRPDMSPFKFLNLIDRGEKVPVFGDGSQARDFTYIDDIAKGTISAMKEVGFEIINLGGGKKPYTLNFMINKIENLLEKKAKIIYSEFNKADMMVTWADINKASRLLNWQPETCFEDGLKKMADDYFKNQDFYKTLKI